MIIINLSEILGKKKLKLSDVINKTGISRPTLTALYYGTGKGVTFEVLNKLCSVLGITPGDLIKFYNVNILEINVTFDKVTFDKISNFDVANFSGFVKLIQDNNLREICFSGSVFVSGHMNINDDAHDTIYDCQILFENLSKNEYCNLWPEEAMAEIEKGIMETIEKEFSNIVKDPTFVSDLKVNFLE